MAAAMGVHSGGCRIGRGWADTFWLLGPQNRSLAHVSPSS